MELIESLVSKLGISTDQTEGGIGVLLKTAKEKLPEGDFSQITNNIPGWEKYVSAAQDSGEEESSSEGGGLLGSLGGIASSLGVGGSIGSLAGMLGGFEKLGLDMSMLQNFIPAVVEFLKEKGGAPVAKILENLVK